VELADAVAPVAPAGDLRLVFADGAGAVGAGKEFSRRLMPRRI